MIDPFPKKFLLSDNLFFFGGLTNNREVFLTFLGFIVFAGIVYNTLTQALGMRGVKVELEEVGETIVSLPDNK